MRWKVSNDIPHKAHPPLQYQLDLGWGEDLQKIALCLPGFRVLCETNEEVVGVSGLCKRVPRHPRYDFTWKEARQVPQARLSDEKAKRGERKE